MLLCSQLRLNKLNTHIRECRIGITVICTVPIQFDFSKAFTALTTRPFHLTILKAN